MKKLVGTWTMHQTGTGRRLICWIITIYIYFELNNLNKYTIFVNLNLVILLLQDNNSVTELVDNYLGHLYPDYHDHTRSVLVRQTRDLLLCTYQGNLWRLEEEFLAPAANLIAGVKRVCKSGQVSLLNLIVGNSRGCIFIVSL